jgi:hypothetical protein
VSPRGLYAKDVVIASPLLAAMRAWFAAQRGGRSATGPDPAIYNLNAAPAGSRWELIQSWYTVHRPFASNPASRGTDLRVIGSWMGTPPGSGFVTSTSPSASTRVDRDAGWVADDRNP